MRRLAGLESEYAISFRPKTSRRPSNARVYNAIMRSVADAVRTVGPLGDEADAIQEPLFVQNGGAFSYEVARAAFDGGLLEGATPECTSGFDVVTYQRAQEMILRDALADAEAYLRAEDYPGTITLLKNCRDARGRLYGAQENYEVEVARGWRLSAMRTGLALTMPLVLLSALVLWALLVAMFAIALPLGLLFLIGWLGSRLVPAARQRLDAWLDRDDDDRDRSYRPVWARALTPLERVLAVVSVAPWALVSRCFALHAVRRELGAFFASRPVFTGAGTLDGDVFRLSEKAQGTRHVMRHSVDPDARALFDLPAVLGGPSQLTLFRPRVMLAAFRRRQRMQVGQSDANMAQTAEYLKVGTMLLLLDVLEAGGLHGAPQLVDPMAALHTFDADPRLQATAELTDGREVTALWLQRWYLRRVREHFATAEVVPLETHRVLRLWEQTLDGLEGERSCLFGRIDWVTKAHLLAENIDLSHAARKKIDLRYHDIVGGYLRQLEAGGLAPVVVELRLVHRAVTNPPADSPAHQRGRLVVSIAQSGEKASVGWERVRIGGLIRGRTVRLR